MVQESFLASSSSLGRMLQSPIFSFSLIQAISKSASRDSRVRLLDSREKNRWRVWSTTSPIDLPLFLNSLAWGLRLKIQNFIGQSRKLAYLLGLALSGLNLVGIQ